MDRVARFLLFFAAMPPEWLAGEIARSREIMHGVEKRIEDARLHVTLLLIGWFPSLPEPLVAALRAIVDGARPDAFRLLFEERIARADRVLLKPAESLLGVERCQRRLLAALRGRGLHLPRDAVCVPHMTLGYASREAGVRAITPIGWQARELVLICSERGRHRHDVLGRWALDPPELPPPQLSATA